MFGCLGVWVFGCSGFRVQEGSGFRVMKMVWDESVIG